MAFHGVRHQDSPSATVPPHGASEEAVASPSNQCSLKSVEAVPESIASTSPSMEGRFENSIPQTGSHAPPQLHGTKRAAPPPLHHSGDGADNEASEDPNRKKLRLSPEVADVESAAPVVPVIPPSALEEGSPTGAVPPFRSSHGSPRRSSASPTSCTVKAGQHREVEPPAVAPHELPLSQPSTDQYGSFNQHLLSSPRGPKEPTFDKPEHQVAVASASSTAHETAPQHATGQSQADVSELERPIQRQLNAASQPASSHPTTTTIVASGRPRMDARLDNADNHQDAGSTFCCPEPQIPGVAGPSTPHQAVLQPQLETLDPERLLELQQSESDDGGSSPVASYEVALEPYLDLPSPSHYLAYTAHESPGSDISLSPPSSPDAFPPPGLLLHLNLIPSFSDLMAAYAPVLFDLEEPEVDEFDVLINLAETLEELNPPGMSQAEIERLESYQFIPQVNESETAFCVVCRSHYQAEELVLVLPCGHEYHSSCAEQWLQISRTCPICRRNASN